MRRDDVIARLRKSEPALRARGIRRAAVFGSVARGDGGITAQRVWNTLRQHLPPLRKAVEQKLKRP